MTSRSSGGEKKVEKNYRFLKSESYNYDWDEGGENEVYLKVELVDKPSP